jgi:hypothetical protein
VALFFNGKQKEVQAMAKLMMAMLHAEDHTCLNIYIKSRQKGMAMLLQAASASGGGAVPAAAQQQRQIQECASDIRHQLCSSCLHHAIVPICFVACQSML